MGVKSTADMWRKDLESWAIPDEILRCAPESPWGFPATLFERATTIALTDPAPSPSRQRALEALPEGGSVLDVGAGTGAASLPLAARAGLVVAVDEAEEMLAAFAKNADDLGVARHEEVRGRWPEVAPRVEPADIVVCHHVVYNVAELAPFVAALSACSRRRVVVELTVRHPQSDLNELWERFHGLVRPGRPTSDDALEVVRELGLDARIERFERPSLWDGADIEDRVAFARRRLCVGPERDQEIAAWLAASLPAPRQLATIWWDT